MRAWRSGWKWAVLVGAVAALAGCAMTRPNATSSAAIYTSMQQAKVDYLAARKAMLGGDQTAAPRVQQALAQLQGAADACTRAPGCDPGRVIALYAHLLAGPPAAASSQAAEPSTESDVTVEHAIPQAQRTVTLLHGHRLSQLMAINGPMKAALEEWLTWRRPKLMRAWHNYAYLRHLMWPQFHKAGLPEAILFGILAKESDGKVHAVSHSGAKGPMQFMPSTARRFGLRTVDGFDERFSPRDSARAAADYLNEQLKVFNDNLELVLAAYNGGEGRVRRLVDGRSNVSFYDPDIYFALPQQTRSYVPLVLAAAWLFLHPSRYHLHWPKIDAQPGHVTLAREASLSELSICLGQDAGSRDGWFRTLRNLNPRLDSQQEQPVGTRINLPSKLEHDYQRDCVTGRWPTLAARLHAGTDPSPPSGLPSRYTVRPGDTLSDIVNRLGCSSVRTVARMNHISRHTYVIRVGQHLTLPRCP